ncbi:protein kinase [Georgenia sp. AZ-5]|uniref:protein kinase domain-containing protein n=1 Tax=Georgenia sp. AZ-5 TaxID=3367526 RepID=UPI003754256F
MRRTPRYQESAVPAVPGYRLDAPVGFGASGAVWAARDRAGRPAVVALLRLPPGERGAAQLRRLGRLRATAHPHLPQVLDLVALTPDRCALVSEPLAGPTLATVRAARGALAPGEVATLLMALGSALGHLHERGIVHGDVSPRNVLVCPGGVPVLTDLAGEVTHESGTAGFVPPERQRGGPAGAHGDVWALARLLLWAGGEEPALARLLGPALEADPSRRPAARDLATRALAVPRVPVALPGAADLAQAQLRAGARHDLTLRAGRTRPRGRHGRGGGRRAVALGTLGLLVIAGAASAGGPASTGSAEGMPAGRPTSAADVRDTPPRGSAGPGGPAGAGAAGRPEAGVANLLAARDAALEELDGEALERLTVPGSPAAREDAALLDRLRSTGTRPAGLRTELLSARVLAGEPVVVEVVTRQRAYELAPVAPDGVGTGGAGGPAGRGTGAVPEQPARCARLELGGPPWRVAGALPCPGP